MFSILPWRVLAFSIVGFLLATAPALMAQQAIDQAVQVTAVAQTNPPAIMLVWPQNTNAISYTIYRKPRDRTSWGSPILTLGSFGTNYMDTNVIIGQGYEYRVSKSDTAYGGEGYVYSGIQMPLVENRGTVILLVDKTQASALTMELARLQQDLVGDGWVVIRHDVMRTDSVASTKALIVADYMTDTNNVNTVFLFGHVPVPYSGDIFPDGHLDHQGAWPADGFYGDIDGIWSDSTVNDMGASDPRNWNVPSDGKYDQFQFNSTIKLQVGRVDLSNLPAFALSETELLRQYLNKDYHFRHKLISVAQRGLIDDNFGVQAGEAFAVSGWRSFAALFGPANTFSAPWSNLYSQGYLWAYGCGPADYTLAQGVTSTSELAANDPQVVFIMLYGSYFGDWDCTNDLLRAVLATPTYTLTSAWAGRPLWHFHHMGLGETVGFSARVVQNNDGNQYDPSYLYDAPTFSQFVHIALMGDPTLRMYIVAPPTGLTISTNPTSGFNLNWIPSPDMSAGYAVYRATNARGPFTRLNSGLLTTNRFVDPSEASAVYMVRAVKLEVTPSGSYFNSSSGIFEDTQGSFNSPSINYSLVGSSFQLNWSGNAVGFQLECCSSLAQSAWQPVIGSVQLTNGWFQVQLPAENTNQFFRLVRDQ